MRQVPIVSKDSEERQRSHETHRKNCSGELAPGSTYFPAWSVNFNWVFPNLEALTFHRHPHMLPTIDDHNA